jgi:predicted metal-dependent hydrolase
MQLELPFLRSAVHEPTPSEMAIELVRVRAARRYILRVRPDGTLRVTLPRWGSKREALAFVATERRWVEQERARVLSEHAPRDWHSGTTILLDGQPVRIEVQENDGVRTAMYGNRRVRVREGTSIRDAIEADMRSLARERLVPRLQELAAEFGLKVARVSIRGQRSRWGSCSRHGAIALNFRLLQTPPEVRDYVLLHELMHLRQQNHSRRFWRLVEAACPRFREAERWLKVQGKALF